MFFIFSQCFLIVTSLFAGGGDIDTDFLLKEVDSRFSDSSGVEIDVKKTLKLTALNRTKIYSGKIQIASNGRFKMEFTEPQRSMILINGKKLYVVEFTDPSIDTTTRVLISQKPEKSQSQALAAFLLGQGRILDFFKTSQVKNEGSNYTYTLLPRQENLSIKKLEVRLSSDSRSISSITYWDELENLTQLEFKNTAFDKKYSQATFEFKPPKDSEITEL